MNDTNLSLDRRIYLIRGCRVMLDSELADLYGVSTGRLNEQVRRNPSRFPADFMFTLTPEEFKVLISQIAISNEGWGGRRKLPMVFTQEGVAMLSSVLRSERAVAVNVAIMRAFVRMREMIAAHKELAQKLEELERKVKGHDVRIDGVIEAIKRLMAPQPLEPKRKIGFRPD